MHTLKSIARWTYAPLMLLGLNATAITLVQSGAPKAFLAALLILAIAISFIVERFIPYQEDWNNSKGDTLRDVLHALVNESSIAMSVLFIPLLAALTPFPSIWPESWPLWTQLLYAIFIADAGITLIHWASHHNKFLWRFHAVHHSVTRMYGFNGLMKHPFHQAIELMAGTAPLILAGMPLDIAVLLAFAVAVQLLLQHSNADMQIGAMRRLLALAPVHRFHHLKSSTEGNVNFGLFTTLWDHLLGTARFDADRRFFPGDLGIDGELSYPMSYVGQLIRPFRRGG